MGFLSEIVERVREELEQRPLNEGTLMLRTKASPPPLDFEGALRRPGISLVAEVMRASPSAGLIADRDPGEQAVHYERGGAAAVSVLTEPRFFDGSLLDLRSVRRKTTLPTLRKDFIIHPAQVIETRAEGADAVILIAAALSALELEELRNVAKELGMATVVEASSREDLDKAVASGANVIVLSGRDPQSLEVDTDRAMQLIREAPRDTVLVLEGGIESRRRVMEAEDAGADAVLVGEVLMRSDHPEVTIRRLLGALQVAGQDEAG